MNKKIIFTTGGTGGHIFPAINLMKHFIEKGYEVLLVTDERGKIFAKNYSEISLYILKTGTPTNKNFFEKILSYFIIFFFNNSLNNDFKKRKARLSNGFWRICFFSYLYCL